MNDKGYELVHFCECDKYAIQSYCAVHNVSEEKNLGDITQVDENNLKPFDVIFGGSPCFVEGTLVLTDNGYIPIEKIKVGDKVLTHTNQYQSVLRTMTNQTDKLVGVYASPTEIIWSTPEHPYYARKKVDGGFGEPEWVQAKDLSKEYFLGTAVNVVEELPKWDGYTYHFHGEDVHKNELTEMFKSKDFWYIVGRYIGDGWLKTYDGKTVIICTARDKMCSLTDRLDALNINYCIVEERTVYKVQIVKKELYLYLERFGKGAMGKHLIGDVLNLPVDLLKAFMEGYINSDGTFATGHFKISSISRRLIYDVSQCVVKVYHRPFSIYFTRRPNTCIIEGRVVNQHDTYQIAWKPEESDKDRLFYEDGYVWSPISKIKEDEAHELVYNLEVENDNSYVVQNLIVHNCQDFSISGKQAGSKWKCEDCGTEYNPLVVHHSKRKTCPACGSTNINKTRSSLLVEFLRVIKAKKPKWGVYENVKNITGKKFIDTFNMFLEELHEYGYSTYYKVLNAKDYGIPQNRERVYVVFILKELDNGKFKFPEPFDNGIRLKDMLDDEVDDSYYINNERADNCIKDILASGKLDKEYSNSIRVGGEALSIVTSGI